MQVTWWLDDGDAPREEVGGKGIGLLALQAAGFAIPPGFVVTTAGTASLDSPAVLSEIVSAWSLLSPSGEHVAVRSSATDEDGTERSFAGQYKTFLDIRDRDSLLDAIERCVASGTSRGAQAYASGDVRMAVVVQRMVTPVFSGVAFSVDPMGAQDRVVVEVTEGTGEALMAGQVRGTRLVMDRATSALIQGDAGEIPQLPGQLGAIMDAALRCEELLGTPQDIEFAYDGDELWLLQTRPITGLRVDSGADGRLSEFDTATDSATEWTSANVQEVLPGLLTPLTITTSARSSRIGYNEGFARLNMLERGDERPFMGAFANRAYLNLTLTKLVADRTLGGSAEGIERQYLAGDGQSDYQREAWWRRARFKMRSAWPLTRMLLSLDGTVQRMERATIDREREVAGLETGELSDADLQRRLDGVGDFAAGTFGTHLQVSGVASFGYGLVTRFVEPLWGDETGSRLPTLFSGMERVESARIGIDIWDLATVARNTGLAGRVGDASFNPGAPDLPDGWRAAWRTFMAAHGHRGVNEMEAAARPWRVVSGPVVDMVRSYLALPPERSPRAQLRRQRAERLRVAGELTQRMQWPKSRAFRKVLAEAQGWVSLRERSKSVIVRAARIADYLMPEVQRRLTAAEVIDTGADVYFLTHDELAAFLGGEREPQQGRVVRRRREYERNRYVQLPARFTGRPAPIETTTVDDGAMVLEGTGVSPGRVTGRARVVLDASANTGMEPGEILVAPVTDAGWTPLFTLATGLVVELGSALSHGSTVAREYGLPAVVNVEGATRRIRTGDVVTVDGTTGRVTIGEEAGP